MGINDIIHEENTLYGIHGKEQHPDTQISSVSKRRKQHDVCLNTAGTQPCPKQNS